MGKKVEGEPEKTENEPKNNEGKYPKRKPRGALFDSGDPTPARRIEEEPEGACRMGKKTEEQPEKAKKEHKDEEKNRPKRKPRGGVLHGEDPTLARRVEEELYDFGR